MNVVPTLIVVFGLSVIIAADFLRRNRVRVQFGMIESSPERGDVVAREARVIERPSSGTSKPFGLRFYRLSGRSFRAKVVHILPATPNTLHGEIVSVQQSQRGYELHGKETEYFGGGVRRMQLSATDPLGKYEVQLFVNGSLAKAITYNVVSNAS